MKSALLGRVLGITCVVALASPALAEADGRRRGCHIVSGQIFELEVPANDLNNPLNGGRVVAVVTGTLKGAETAILTGFPSPIPGGLSITTQNVFVNKRGEMLVATGLASITFNPDGTVADDLVMTVDGASSTGRFAGATGTIRAIGTGFNFGGGPGVGRFVFRYRGQICGLSHFDGDDD
jgi:hypothetical protein